MSFSPISKGTLAASSVVDEHVSRALGNVKSPQGLSSSSQSGDAILRNVKEIYFPLDGGPASTSLAVEKSQPPERRKDLFFY